jgi:hypothetical protein
MHELRWGYSLLPATRRELYSSFWYQILAVYLPDDAESPTVVLDGNDVTPSHLQTLQQQVPPHLGVIVPPITVADGVVTPDPFRDVIRTEPAPDLPSLIEDMMPYLRHTSTSTTPTTTTAAKSFTTSTQDKRTSAPVSFTQTPTPSGSIALITTDLLREISDNKNKGGPLEEKIPHGIDLDDNFNAEEDKDEDSGFSLDTVIQFLFSGDHRVTHKTRRPDDSSMSQETMTMTHNTTSAPPSDNTSDDNTMQSENTTVGLKTSSKSQDVLNLMTGSTPSSTQYTITPQPLLTTGLNSVNPTASSREPPPGRPPNLQHPQLPAPVSADPGAASGLLKLAGCNIYGRMYRVGRIISELSGPCLECMCTEVGVQCRKLDC